MRKGGGRRWQGRRKRDEQSRVGTHDRRSNQVPIKVDVLQAEGDWSLAERNCDGNLGTENSLRGDPMPTYRLA